MKFSEFAVILDQIENTPSRLDMTGIAVDLLRKLKGQEVKQALYLMQGRVVPEFIPIEFNVSKKLMQRSITQAFDLETRKVEKDFKQVGDLGRVVELYQKKAVSMLTISDVYLRLSKVAYLSGVGSQAAKVGDIADLIKDCDKGSSRYVTRMILGNLRLGLSSKTVLDALSMLAVGDKSKRALLDRAFGLRSDIGYVASKVIDEGINSLAEIDIEVGVPVQSMNCEREAGIGEVLKRNKEWVIQPKYDGLRAQVHYSKPGFTSHSFIDTQQKQLFEQGHEHFSVFSRNLESLTNMFPDVGEAIIKLGVDSIVLDCEAVGYDESGGKYYPFQQTIQRRRKHKVGEKVLSIPIKLFAFDLLYLNGKDLSEQPLCKRLEELNSVLKKSAGQSVICMTPSKLVSQQAVFEKKFQAHIADGVEGIIAKHPLSPYLPGKRGYDWIKLKKSLRGHLVDNIDTVVLGYYAGKGARAQFGIGALLVGILNSETNMFESIAKVGTGMKDEDWRTIKSRLDEIALEAQPKDVVVSKVLYPDVWVRPEVLMTVDADEITTSPSHKAGLKDGKGYSLRFPRMKEFDRKDKSVDMTTTVKEIIKMYSLQK